MQPPYSISQMSAVRLSACLSVKRVNCGKTKETSPTFYTI